MTTETKQPLMDISEVAQYLNCSQSFLYKYTESGRIPHLRIGNRIRYRRDEIDAWMASNVSKDLAP